MSLTIAEALDQAQRALNGGDFGSAAMTCVKLVTQYPAYASAYHLLGEAHREQGQADDAGRAFAAARNRHPRLPATYLGLGLIAEDQGANEAALAFCQVAWELAPNQMALREPLTRVSLRRYGADGELQLTHAALAQMHASASRLRRAAAEYRLALAQLPSRVDLQLGLVEALWRLGDDGEALRLGRALVEHQPECAPALVILTDIEHRSGNTRRADELLTRLRAIDPDGEIAASMLALNSRADRQFLELPADAMPILSEDIVVAAPERPKIAPAPDFEYRPTRSEIPTPDINQLAPMSFEEFGAADDQQPATGSDSEAFNLDDLGDLPEGLEPISVAELGGLTDEMTTEPSFDEGFDVSLNALDMPTEVEPPAPFTLEEVLQFESPSTDAGSATGAPPPAEPFDDQLLFSAPAAAAPESAGPADVVVDDLASLAASLEFDVADALNRAGEPVAPTIDTETSRPPDAAPRGYTTVLRGLEDQGFAPFDPRSRAPVEGMPSMLPDDLSEVDEAPPAAGAEAIAAGESAPQSDEFGKITRDWDTIDDEIQAAMPVTPGRGYTEELRSLGEIGLTPFEVEPDDEALEGLTPFNPFSSEPITSTPAADAAPPPPAVDSQPAAGVEHEMAGPGATEELLGGLQPFAFEEFDSGETASSDTQSRSFFNQGGWEGSSSAVPSDADLDTLLAFEDDEPLSIPELESTQDTDQAPSPAVTTEGEPSAEDFLVTQAPSPPAETLDDLQTPPGLSEADLNEFFESSVAVTRQLPGDATHPMLQSDPPEAASPEAISPEAPSPEDALPEAAQPEPAYDAHDLNAALRPGTEVFTRARAVKVGLMSEGRIDGTRELDEGITTDDLIAMEDRLKTRDLPAADTDIDADAEADADEYDDDDDLIASTGATRDTTTLRAALEVTPDDDELRWWLAEALRDRGDLDDACVEYRWLIRHAPHRHDQILDALNESVERDQMPETAHRLLGDIYRRRGDVTRASNHASLALQVRRRSGRVR